jgi:hypothetical protein
MRGLLVFKRADAPGHLSSDVKRDLAVVTRYARLQVGLRGLLLLGSLTLLLLCYWNCYGWFNALRIAEGGVSLEYRWPKPDAFIPWKKIKVVGVERARGGQVLQLSTGKDNFQSVRVPKTPPLKKVQAALQERVDPAR